MKFITRLKLVVTAVLAGAVLCTPVLASAVNEQPFETICTTGGGAASAVCRDRQQATNPISGADGILVKVARLIATITGIAAVLMIIIAGIRMALANGDSQTVQSSRNQIIFAMVGLVIALLAQLIIVFVLNRVK